MNIILLTIIRDQGGAEIIGKYASTFTIQNLQLYDFFEINPILFLSQI